MMSNTIFLIVFSIICLTIIIVFLVPHLFVFIKKKAIDRFFRGRIQDETIWGEKVKEICEVWLNKTPIVKDNDESRFFIIELFKNTGKASIQAWQSAALYIALDEYYQTAEDKNDRRCLTEFEDSVRELYSLNHIQDSDFGMLAFALSGSDGFNDFENAMLEYIKDNVSDDGIVLYKSNAKQTAFVDTLGFVCPFMVKYGVATNNDEFIRAAEKQFEYYFNYGLEKNSGLPFHAFSIDSHIKRGICDWARGLAWLLIGLLDSYKVLKAADKDSKLIRNSISKYAEILVEYQKGNGGFAWQLLSGYATDSSAVAVFGWYLACCYKLFGNVVYLERAKMCREFLMIQTRNNGIIDFCQGDTMGVGVYSRSFDVMPFAQGFALRLQRELLGC